MFDWGPEEAMSEEIADECLYNERLRTDREKVNIESIINNLDFFHLKCGVSMLTINELKNTLRNFSLHNGYSEQKRALFFFINDELTRRNIAPVWRGIVKIKYSGSKKISEAKQRYSCDIQIIDLLWIHSQLHGQKVNNTAWYDLYENVFEKDFFDYEQADNIACAGFKLPEKIKGLKLKDSIQIQLAVLRSEKNKKRIYRAITAAHEVEIHIHNAADANPRKGKKVSDQAEVWSKIWLCRKLAGSSPQNIADMYYQMTGDTINFSVLRNKLNKIAAALHEVNSPYYRDMLKKK